MGFFTGKLAIPEFVAMLAIMAEGLGSLGLISGFLTRVASFSIVVYMGVVVYLVHFQNAFCMNS